MKNLRVVSNGRSSDLNKNIREALYRGEIISSLTEYGTGELRAKVTEAIINNAFYYGIWEKDLLEGKWHLLHVGEQEEVESEWNEYIDFWTKQGEITPPMIA